MTEAQALKIEWEEKQSAFGDKWYRGTCGEFTVEMSETTIEEDDYHYWTWNIGKGDEEELKTQEDVGSDCETKDEALVEIEKQLRELGAA